MDNHQATPPNLRTAIWPPISDAAKSEEFVLQVCRSCATIQYPPRELCKDCLKNGLEWQKVSAKGEIISHTVLHASTNVFFRQQGPRQIALVKLDIGPVIFTHIAYDEVKVGDRIYILNRIDLSGEGVFIAIVEEIDEQTQLDELHALFLTK